SPDAGNGAVLADGGRRAAPGATMSGAAMNTSSPGETITIYVPRDAAALAVGADAVAAAIEREAARRGVPVRIVRNGPRGRLWLEPLAEVVTPAGRVAYGPVSAADVPGLFDAGWLHGAGHALCHGIADDIAYLAQQERLTFA